MSIRPTPTDRPVSPTDKSGLSQTPAYPLFSCPSWCFQQHQSQNTNKDCLEACFRGRELNANFFFLELLGRPRDIRAKSRSIRPKSFVSLGFEGHAELFGPHPFTRKTPTPPEDIRSQKVLVWVPFSSLMLGCTELDSTVSQESHRSLASEPYAYIQANLCHTKTRGAFHTDGVCVTHVGGIPSVAETLPI